MVNIGHGVRKSNKITTVKKQKELACEEVQRLVTLAGTSGEISIAEINERLPPEIVAPQALDRPNR